MALANLVVKIGADIAELKTGSDNAVRAMEKTSSKIDSIGSSIKGMILGAFSVSAVVGFGQELLRMGDDIVRTADRTGLLTDEVQKLSFIAGQSGNSLEEITGAIGQLQNRLSSGDKGAVGAVQSLGLSLEGLGKLDTYDQMAAIADAIGRVPDPAKRAQLAMDLFGRSGIALLPTLTAQFKELGDAAPVMEEDVVRALDSAGDAFDKLTLQLKVFAANLYNAAGKAFDKLIADFYRLIGGLYDGTVKIVQLTAKIPGSSKIFGDLNDNIASLTQTSHWYKDAASSLEAGAVKAARTVSTQYAPAVTAAGKAHEVATTHTKAHVAAIKEEVTVLPEVAHALELLEKVRAHQIAAADLETAAWKRTQSAMDDYVKHIPKAELIIQGRDLSSIVPMLDAGGAGNLAGAGRSGGQSWFSGFTDALKGSDFGSALQHALGNMSSIGSALKGFASNVATDFIGTALSFIPGIGPVLSQLAGPLVTGFKNLWGHFFGTAGRDAVKDFANSFGGFDALHVKLNDLGADGERLWIQLTQGVGRNNPQQAQAAIEAITSALDKQKEKQDAVGEAAATAAQSQSEAYQKAKDAIASLDGQIKTLSDSIAGEAPEEFMGIVEQQTRERIKAITDERNKAQEALDSTARSAAEGAEKTAQIIQETLDAHDFVAKVRFELGDLPGGSGERPEGYATGTRGGFVDFGAGTHVVLHGRERIVTEGEALGVGGGDTYVYIGNKAIDGHLVTVAKNAAATGRLRPRATSGRSS